MAIRWTDWVIKRKAEALDVYDTGRLQLVQQRLLNRKKSKQPVAATAIDGASVAASATISTADTTTAAPI